MKLKDIKLVYNAAAHFNAAEKYPEGLIEELKKPGKASFDALCWTLAEMAKQGELVRRYMGEDAKEIPSEETFKLGLKPTQLIKATEMVFTELAKGMGAGDDDDEEIDLVLCEIQKQKKTKAD